MTVPTSASLQISGAYTVSLWFNLNTLTQVSNPTLFSTRNGGDTTFDLQFINGVFHGDIGAGGGWLTTGADSSVQSLQPNTWNMITYSVNSTGYSVYLNGTTKIGSGAFAGTPLLLDATRFISIGAQREGGAAFTARTFVNGLIDEVNIVNTALTQAQVNALYNSVNAANIPGTLPPGTAVNLTSATAVLNITGSPQTIGSLTGVANSSVVLGAAALTVGSANSDTTFAGNIS